MLPGGCRTGQGKIDQVVIMVDPHVQDGLEFHLVRLRVVGADLPYSGGKRAMRRS
jgi:hypothetical protein